MATEQEIYPDFICSKTDIIKLFQRTKIIFIPTYTGSDFKEFIEQKFVEFFNINIHDDLKFISDFKSANPGDIVVYKRNTQFVVVFLFLMNIKYDEEVGLQFWALKKSLKAAKDVVDRENELYISITEIGNGKVFKSNFTKGIKKHIERIFSDKKYYFYVNEDKRGPRIYTIPYDKPVVWTPKRGRTNTRIYTNNPRYGIPSLKNKEKEIKNNIILPKTVGVEKGDNKIDITILF